jgi:ABC-type polysaccharide/polyol phosphate transport system ATPase subunit
VAATETSAPVARSAGLSGAPDIKVHGVSKTFRLPRRQVHTLKERVLHPREAHDHDTIEALRDVSFEVGRGEFFGIVGRNGSGKSTLLKCLAGIYSIDCGEMSVLGRLSPFIELGVGFNPELTARDNVIINAIMLGLSRKEAAARFDDIIAFAELERFLDLKLKNYSSGMSVRLAFATAIQVDADVLLIDEVLAVGDASFQQKCFEQFTRMKDEGRTMLFVTHDMGAVERFCDRAMLIERGEVLGIGPPATIARKYNELNFGRLAHAPGAGRLQATPEASRATIRSAWFEDGRGEHVVTLGQGEACRMCFEVEFNAPVDNPVFSCALRNDARHTVFAASSSWEHGPTGSFAAGDRVVVRVDVEMWLAPSRYTLSPTVAADGTGALLDVREDLASMVLQGAWREGGLAALPHQVRLERA